MIIYGLISLGTGFLGIFAGSNEEVAPMIGNNHRFKLIFGIRCRYHSSIAPDNHERL